MTEETLETAGEMYIYLIYCPSDSRTVSWSQFYRDLLTDHQPTTILLTLARVLSKVKKTFRQEYNVANSMFLKFSSLFKLRKEIKVEAKLLCININVNWQELCVVAKTKFFHLFILHRSCRLQKQRHLDGYKKIFWPFQDWFSTATLLQNF